MKEWKEYIINNRSWTWQRQTLRQSHILSCFVQWGKPITRVICYVFNSEHSLMFFWDCVHERNWPESEKVYSFYNGSGSVCISYLKPFIIYKDKRKLGRLYTQAKEIVNECWDQSHLILSNQIKMYNISWLCYQVVPNSYDFLNLAYQFHHQGQRYI